MSLNTVYPSFFLHPLTGELHNNTDLILKLYKINRKILDLYRLRDLLQSQVSALSAVSTMKLIGDVIGETTTIGVIATRLTLTLNQINNAAHLKISPLSLLSDNGLDPLGNDYGDISFYRVTRMASPINDYDAVNLKTLKKIRLNNIDTDNDINVKNYQIFDLKTPDIPNDNSKDGYAVNIKVIRDLRLNSIPADNDINVGGGMPNGHKIIQLQDPTDDMDAVNLRTAKKLKADLLKDIEDIQKDISDIQDQLALDDALGIIDTIISVLGLVWDSGALKWLGVADDIAYLLQGLGGKQATVPEALGNTAAKLNDLSSKIDDISKDLADINTELNNKYQELQDETIQMDRRLGDIDLTEAKVQEEFASFLNKDKLDVANEAARIDNLEQSIGVFEKKSLRSGVDNTGLFDFDYEFGGSSDGTGGTKKSLFQQVSDISDTKINFAGDVTGSSTISNLTSGNSLNISLNKTLDQIATSGTINISNNRITSVATPTFSTDAVNKKYVDDNIANLQLEIDNLDHSNIFQFLIDIATDEIEIIWIPDDQVNVYVDQGNVDFQLLLELLGEEIEITWQA